MENRKCISFGILLRELLTKNVYFMIAMHITLYIIMTSTDNEIYINLPFIKAPIDYTVKIIV